MKRPIIALAASFLAVGALAQGNPETIERIILEGKTNGNAMKTLMSLGNDVGPRLTGSKALERGYIWAIKKFTDVGLTNVSRWKWGEIPTGFDRGERQTVRLVEPYVREFVFSTPCWTVGTDGPVRGLPVRQPESVEDVEAMGDKLKGAWILMPRPVGMGSAKLRNPTDLDKALDAAGIAGRIYRTNGDLVWTSGTWRDYTDETRPKTPLIVVRKQDYEMIEYNIDKGRKTTLEVDVENIITKRVFPAYNVIGEIKGSEKPDEVVIVCGHFDSWNGPGSQGASDNGTGTTTTIEAARLLNKVGAKPKRTIRFILWTGEEQGLLGSAQYVKHLQDTGQLENVAALINEDSGNNWHAGIAGLDNMMPQLREAVAPLKDAFPNMPVEAREVNRFPRGGSDHAVFVQRGVPAFFMQKGGNLPYRYVWHTQNDHFREVPEINLKQMATTMAVLAYQFAEAEEMLPRVPNSRTERQVKNVGGYFEDHHDCALCGLPHEMGYSLARTAF